MTHFTSDEALRDFLASPLISDEQKVAIRTELAERTAPRATAYGDVQDGRITWDTLDNSADAVRRGDGDRQLVRLRGPVEVLDVTEAIVGRRRERTITPTGTFLTDFIDPHEGAEHEVPAPATRHQRTVDPERLAEIIAEHERLADRARSDAHYAGGPKRRDQHAAIARLHEDTVKLLRLLAAGGPA